MTRKERQERALERRERDLKHWRDQADYYDYLDKEDKMTYCQRKAHIAAREVKALRVRLGKDTGQEG